MTPQNSNDERLQEREQALRLREIEAEIDQPSQSATVQGQKRQGALHRRYKPVVEVAKFVGIVLAVVVAVKVASWVARTVIIGAIAWVVYMLFFKRDRRQR